MPTTPTLELALDNKTSTDTVYAYVTGRAIDNNRALCLLRSDGVTPYFPSSPSSTVQPIPEDCAIPLGPRGSSKRLIIPRLEGARIWFSLNGQLKFFLNPGPALVEPSVNNPADPNLLLSWTFAEFTYNASEIYANISYVDFVSVPVNLTLTTGRNTTSSVTGMPAGGLQQVVDKLETQDAKDKAGWGQLVVRHPETQAPLRVMSPNAGIVSKPNLFRDLYTAYVDAVWARYASQNLTVNTQNGSPGWGVVDGRVNPADGILTIAGRTFSKPSAKDIFSCSTGPFAELGDPLRGAIIARVSAAFNRSTLLEDSTIPDDPPAFYNNVATNHYSRIVHEVNVDGRGYAFPYDDVQATGSGDVSGAVRDSEPTLLRVAVGGEGVGGAGTGTGSAPTPLPGPTPSPGTGTTPVPSNGTGTGTGTGNGTTTPPTETGKRTPGRTIPAQGRKLVQGLLGRVNSLRGKKA